MDPIIIAAIAVTVALVIGLLVWQRERSGRLHTQYGQEYDRAVDELGRLRAQRELAGRGRRVKQLKLRALTREQRNRFVASWRAIQSQFVDDPPGAVTEGDRLIEDVIDARGYPIADFDQRSADLSVHHADVVDDYRALRELAHRHRRHEASTEDLRQALVHFRAVFEDLLEDREQVSEVVVELPVEREDVRATPPLGPDLSRRPDSDLRR
ncbi:MAG: hypothetical protein ACT4P6_19270 [Gemmatimonadaceae bacterium]